MQSALVAILALFVTTTALQAQLLPNAQRPKPRPPQLMASENGQNPSPLSLAKADIRTVITGYLAETTMTLTFYNDGARVLEGELSFPLPENATISGYALDVNGVLVDGVPVERQKARITYEKETRKRVDPGLVEQTVGNNFTTRVYPIPAHGSRTIKVQYVADVTDSDKGAVYRLPMNWGQVVKEGSIRVEVVKSASEPVAKSGGAVKLGFTRWEGRFVAEEKLENTKLDDELVIELPDAARAPVLVEKRAKQPTVEELLGGTAAPAGHSDYYFVINDTPAIPEVADGAVRNATRVGILWDASLSRAETDKSRELALLKKLLAHVDPHGGVDIVAFRNEPDAPVSFPMSGGIDPILHHLESLVYDGGTNLSKLSISRLPSPVAGANVRIDPAAYDYWLMFTDGLADLGPEMPAKIEARVYPISNEPHSNHALLRRLATASGGVYFNLERATDEQVMAGLAQSPYALIGVDCNPAEVADIYPHGSQPVLGRVTVTGRLLVPEAKVTLKYGYGQDVLKTQEFTLTQNGATETGLVPRYWAQQKAAKLSSDVEANGAALAAVGKEFNLVTANTSLLVLETVEQYLQYQIVPPKTQPALYAQFMTRIEQQKTQQAQTREERIAAVIALWNQRAQWWNGEYKYAKDFKYGEVAAKSDTDFIMRYPANWPDISEVRDATVRQERAGTAPLSPPSGPAPARQPSAGVPHPGVGGDPNRDAARDVTRDPQHPIPAGSIDAPEPTVHSSFVGSSGHGLSAAKKSITETIASPSIVIKEWDPAVPYLVAMREAGGDGAYAVYLKQRKNFITSPAFYLDCADYLLRNGQKAMGVRVLTNVAELKLENAQLLRIVAHKLNQIGDRELAINLFEKVKTMRPEEPQSYRDLALALADRAEATLAAGPSGATDPKVLVDYEQSLKLLDQVVMSHWDRFDEIEVIALMEANRIIAKVYTLRLAGAFHVPLDPRLIKNLDCDVRIVLTWDADMTDVDLWVTEPSGEKCFYGHNRTTIGGMMSRDFTQGYGPEEYCLKQAMPGQYKIQANYYGSSQASLVGPCTVQATVITDFGRPTETHQYLTLRLTETKEVVDVGAVTLGVPVIMNK